MLLIKKIRGESCRKKFLERESGENVQNEGVIKKMFELNLANMSRVKL